MFSIDNYSFFIWIFSTGSWKNGNDLTLYLISANVYNSVKGPKSRGFSYIEFWMIGTQIPILIALLEYGFILLLKKISKKVEDKTWKLKRKTMNLDAKIKKLDFATMLISFLYFIIFVTVYCIMAFNCWIHTNNVKCY